MIMSIWKLYRYGDQVLIPKMFINEDGAFVEAQPLESIAISERERLRQVLEAHFSVAPVKEDLPQSDSEEDSSTPMVLHKLGLKKWQDFEKKALMYTVHRNGEQMAVYVTGRGTDGMWSVSGSEQLEYSLQDGMTAVCEKIAQEIISRKPVKSTALGLPLYRD